MRDDIHAIIILVTVVSSTCILIWNWASISRDSVRDALRGLIPFAALGTLSSLLMNVNGGPENEWIIPLFLCFFVLAFGKRSLIRRIWLHSLQVISLVLCLNHVELINSGYTSNAKATQLAFDSQAYDKTRFYQDALCSRFSKETEFPNCPLTDILTDLPGTIEKLEIVSLWHSRFTHLYFCQRIHAKLWFPGGTIGDACDRIETRSN